MVVVALSSTILVLFALCHPCAAQVPEYEEAWDGFQNPVEGARQKVQGETGASTQSGFGFLFPTNDFYKACKPTPTQLYHPGIDWNVEGTTGDRDQGTIVRAMGRGIVSWVRPPDSKSWAALVIEHKYQEIRYWSLYGHMEFADPVRGRELPDRRLNRGDIVTKDTIVGYVSNVGATYSHLHWEVRTERHD